MGSAVPQLDFLAYPSQMAWFLGAFVLLYLVVKCKVVPRVELEIRSRIEECEANVGRALVACEYARGVLQGQCSVLEDAEKKAQEMVSRVRAEMAAATDHASKLLGDEIHEMMVIVEEYLGALREDYREELLVLSAEIATMYCDEVGGCSEANKERIREMAAGLYGKKI